MAEPSVQVPVSLIEDTATVLERAGYHGTAERLRDALLSQPTPSANLDANWQTPNAVEGHSGTCNTQTIQGIGCDCKLSRPDLPAIEDMAPGTTFTAQWRGTDARPRFVKDRGVEHTVHLVDRPGFTVFPARIDPSTIRDVQEPA